MSEEIGLVRCVQHHGAGFAPEMDGLFQRDCSEHTAEQIDAEVKKMLDTTYAEAKHILSEHHDQLDCVAAELLKCETMDAQTFNRLIGRKGKDTAEIKVPIEASPEAPGRI